MSFGLYAASVANEQKESESAQPVRDVFVGVGGLFVLRWPRLAWVHVPALVWGVVVEISGWICPLTPLENRLRSASGDPVYTSSFIDQYVVPIIYPVGLTRGMQLLLAATVVVVNLVIYSLVLRRSKKQRSHEG